MADEDLVARIHQLTDEERRLEEAHVGEPLSDPELARLHEVERTLDQLWDLMRQRRALRDAGNDPSLAAERPQGTVEGYRQ
jgi:hypothetical protein